MPKIDLHLRLGTSPQFLLSMPKSKISARSKAPENLSVRERLGVSQQEFANFCGVPKANVSMAESNRRGSFATLPMAHLHQAFAEAQKNPADTAALEKLSPEEVEDAENLYLDLRLKWMRLGRKLKAMQFAYGQAVALHGTCSELQKMMPFADDLANQTLKIWTLQARFKISQNSRYAQKRMSLKRELLEKEMAFLVDELGYEPKL